MTEDELKALCAYWQKALRLQDWNIEIRFVRGTEMENDEGRFCPILTKKIALIKVLDPRDATGDWIQLYDIETIVVHELLHAHFTPFEAEDDTPADTAPEQAINAIASALVAVNRKEVAKVL